jgi:transposase
MCAAINNPTSCEVRAVIRFLHAKQMSAADIHRELCMVYGPNILSEGAVRQWCRMFGNGWTNVHNDERSGRPFVVNDDLVQSVNKKIRENQRFTISELSFEFPHISCTILYEIVTHKLGYHKFCARWVLKMLTDGHKTQRMASALTFLERYFKDGNEFLNHIVTGDETWVSCVNVETKEQCKQ